MHIIGVRVEVSGGESFDPIGLYDIIESAILIKFYLSIYG
jgi:hypothetical protein